MVRSARQMTESQQIQPGFNNTVPDLTPTMPRFAFFVTFYRTKRYFALFEEGFSWPPISPDLNPSDCFLWGYLNDRVFQKNPHAIPKLKTAIQSEIEAVSTSTSTKVLNNFVLRLRKFVTFEDVT
jgi:hypothetical protein